MITLSKSGSTIIFEFDENSGYLQNGTIEVPVNSLSLVVDSSDMITFKKAASNDIFVSALVGQFGMTKAELIAWYKENMVGETGGGGIDSGTVQSMIDESISGKADSANAVASAEYVSSSTTINLKNISGTVISSIDATDFIKDGMIDSVELESKSGTTYLVITWNTDAGKQKTELNIGDLFEADNYYTKSQTSGATEISTALNTKLDSSAFTDTYISGVTVTGSSTPIPTIAQDKVKVTWADGYNATYDVDYSGTIGDGNEHINNNFVKLEFGNLTGTKTLNTEFVVKADDCFSLSSATFVGDVKNIDADIFGSGINLEEVYFFADSPSGFTYAYIYESFLTNVYDGCETYDYVTATYPIYVANLANYQNTVLYNDGSSNVTWGEHFGDRLRQIPRKKEIVFSYNTDKEDITLPTSEITDGFMTSGDVQNQIDSSITGKTDVSAFTAFTSSTETALGNKQDALSNADVLSGISPSDISFWNDKSDFSGLYDDLVGAPTDVSFFYNDAGYITSGEAQTQIDNSISGKVDASTYTAYTAATDAALSGKADTATTYTKTEVDNAITAATSTKQDTLIAGENITISGNVISATGGGGGGMTEDMERLISTALVDLNDRKIDASEVKSNYQKKGDYATKSALDLKANASEVMTLDKSKENELVTATALNSINERLIALEAAVQALQALHNNG